jgi:hypothetical protein
VNPLLLWEIVAGGHIDGPAAAFGLLGIVALRVRTRPGAPPISRARAGRGPGYLLIGVATGLKVEYALLGLAVPGPAAGRSGLAAAAASPW